MLLDVQGLVKTYRRRGETFPAVDHLSFTLDAGELLVLAGESGSGKSTTGRLIAQFSTPDDGKIILDGQDITHVPERKKKELYRHIQMVFQNPMRSFHPRYTLRESILAGIRNYHLTFTEQELQDLLKEVQLPVERLDRYPHEVSGGECQRAAILRALCIKPQILLCDEATSALDVSTRGEVAAMIRNACKRHQIGCLFITHDLLLARRLADRVMVMHNGRAVETGTPNDIFTNPKEAYTKELLASLL